MIFPLKIKHIDLINDRSNLVGEKGARGYYLVFWINNVPLGTLEVSADKLPMPAAAIRLKAHEVILPAVRAMIPAESSNIWSRKPHVPTPEHLDAAYSNMAALIPGPRQPAQCWRISVVICTRNRPHEIKKCLKSLINQSQSPREILVVDNAPDTDATRAVVDEFPRVRYVPEPRPGLDRARNAGIRSSRGDIIAFVDDDVSVHSDWTARIAESFGDPKVTAVTGLVLPTQLRTFSQCYFERYWPLGKGFVMRRFTARFFSHTQGAGSPVWDVGAGANMAFRRQAFVRFGRFDERLDVGAAGCSGDSEFWYRVLAGGEHCLYNPTAVVFHHHRTQMKDLKQQIYNYMKGHATALLIQYEKFGHAGNLRRLVGILPKHFLQRLLLCLRGGFTGENRLLAYEIMGYMAGFPYYSLRMGVRRYITGRTRPFIVIFQGRSGSTYLMEALNQHPDITAHKEVLVALKKEGARHQLKQTKGYLKRSMFKRPLAVGFKTKLEDVLDLDEFAALLKSLDVQVIVLLRKNRVKAAVSWLNAIRLKEKTGDWNLYDEKNRLPPFSVKQAEFESTLNHLEMEKQEINTYVEALGLRTFRLYYEDLFENQHPAFERIFSFLGVRFAEVFGQTLKNTNNDLRQVLENFEDLRRQFRGTPYEVMFD